MNRFFQYIELPFKRYPSLDWTEVAPIALSQEADALLIRLHYLRAERDGRTLHELLAASGEIEVAHHRRRKTMPGHHHSENSKMTPKFDSAGTAHVFGSVPGTRLTPRAVKYCLACSTSRTPKTVERIPSPNR